MRLIDADALKKDDELTEWITRDAIRTGKMLKAFSELFVKKIDDAPTVNAVSEEVYTREYNLRKDAEMKAYKLEKALEQESKTGHWKVVSDGYGDSAYICECSECKDTVWVYKDADRKWNYCPNCGTRMERAERILPIEKSLKGNTKDCRTCIYDDNDWELSGECYECIKGIADHYNSKEQI